jgi:hypothetical protein
LLNDCWRNLRTIFKTPLLSLAIVATLALGFGANIAIFSVLKAVVIRGFPYGDAPRLVLVWMTNPQLGYSEFFVSSPDLKDLIAQNRSFETMGHYGFGLVNLTGSGTPEALLCAWVAPKLLSDLGAATVAGRLFLEDETRAEHERAVVIGYGLWQRRFAARADIVGKAITLNRQVYTIVGVAAREFTGPPGFDIGGTVSNQKPELWIPLNLARKDLGTFDLTQRANRWATVMARLRPGVSLAAAQQELNIASGRLAQQYPEANKGWGIEVRSLGEQTAAGIRTSLWLLMAAVGCSAAGLRERGHHPACAHCRAWRRDGNSCGAGRQPPPADRAVVDGKPNVRRAGGHRGAVSGLCGSAGPEGGGTRQRAADGRSRGGSRGAAIRVVADPGDLRDLWHRAGSARFQSFYCRFAADVGPRRGAVAARAAGGFRHRAIRCDVHGAGRLRTAGEKLLRAESPGSRRSARARNERVVLSAIVLLSVG